MDRQISINYPTPKVNPITPAMPDVEITRMDFVSLEGGKVTVNKLGQGFYGKLVVIQSNPVADLESALSWCVSHGWTVRRWPGGARAWKNGLEPVRSKSEVIRLRDELRNHPRPELQGCAVALDLVYDL
jgi:hypothetical protein